MNQPIPTGPDRFAFAEDFYDKAKVENGYSSDKQEYFFRAAEHHSRQAQTAALVMLTEVIATASGADHDDLDSWREKIGLSWLKECQSMGKRRPVCAEWHTADCSFSDPRLPEGTRVVRRKHRPGQPHGTVNEQRRLPDGKYRLLVQWDGAEEAWVYQDETVIIRHEKLPVGTRVTVNDRMTRYDYKVEYDGHPWVGKITGYASNGCYKIVREWGSGDYSEHTDFVFMDERVKVHPEGPVKES